MLKKIVLLSAIAATMSGCMTNEKISQGRDGMNRLEFSVVKLYASTNFDSAEVIDNVNKELKAGKTIDETLKVYGTYFTDVKFDLHVLDKRPTDFASTNTTSYVERLTDKGNLVPGHYNTGFNGSFYVENIDEGRAIFKYKIKNEILKKIETAPNKIETRPITDIKEIEQTVVVDKKINTATGILNPEPKQYQIYIFKIGG